MHRLLVYIFPFILIAIEMAMRYALGTNTAAFIGPTLASAAAALLVHAVSVKGNPSDTQERINFNELISGLAILLLLIFIAAWVWVLLLAESHDRTRLGLLDRPAWIGLSCYVIAIVVSELKESRLWKR
jgi:hypothetical protein